MILTIFIVLISILLLVTIHELGHFLLARKFGVKVEEFGIGIPPKIIGKKIGETVYSLNLIPLGAFVKLYGEEERIQDPRSFSSKPIWQRVLIVLGGVVAFWIIAAIIISIVAGIWGLPMQIEDTDQGFKNPQIEIAQVMKNSPAFEAELRIWDIIEKAKADNNEITTTKVGEFIDFIDNHKGEEVTLTIKRGKKILNITLVPRVNPPEGEGPIGIEPARVALKVYPWREAIIQGFIVTRNQTLMIIYTLGSIISGLIRHIPLPKGALEVTGIVGIFELLVHAFESGVNNFLLSLASITIFLAIFNSFPIPALDGGKLLFLTIEKIRKKPVSQKIEEKITIFFFGLIMMLGILIIIKDIVTRIS
jgi:regulator of sigma E protease